MNAPTQPDPRIADGLWLAEAQHHGGAHWVANARCRVEVAELARAAVPVTLLARSAGDESYVASARSAWHRYALHEARRHIPPRWQSLADAGLRAAGLPLAGLLAWAGLDRAATLGNWLISTNLHAVHAAADWQALTESQVVAHPDRPLLVRNVCDAVTPGLPLLLRSLGYALLPARTIYLADPAERALWRHHNVKLDQRLLATPGVELVNPGQLRAEDLGDLRTCFRQLFIAKHSSLNPDFTPAFFALCRDSRFLNLFALRHAGRIVGVVGTYQRHGWITAPLLGYDTSMAAGVGLYRRLMALLLHEARDKKCRLHYSAGAGGFKSARGGVAHLEYAAVYARHLPDLQRSGVALLAATLQRWAPRLLARGG